MLLSFFLASFLSSVLVFSSSFAAKGRSLRRRGEILPLSSKSSSLSSPSSSCVFQFNEIYRDKVLSAKEAQMYGLIDHIILPD